MANHTTVPTGRAPRIAAVGLASWDRLLVVDRIAGPGESAIVRQEAALPGGTTSNSAVALARLGAVVSLVAMIRADAEGAALRRVLTAAGVDTTGLAVRRGARTDGATVIVGGDPPDRTIYWHQGAALARGDRLDVSAIFDHDLVIVDVADVPLRRFLTDLPAHTAPAARLLGTLTYLVDSDEPEAFTVAMRHDVLVGNEREYLALTGERDLDAAIAAVRTAMPGTNLRACVASRGPAGCRVVTAAEVWDVPGFAIAAVDATGAGDAFCAGLAYGAAQRWSWPRAARFANAVGALSTRALGAQAALPTLAEVVALLGEPG